jgi:hypothetical protein
MADEQPQEELVAPTQDELHRSFLTSTVNNFESGAALGVAAYGLHKTEQLVTKLKDKVTTPKDEPPKE